jgi:hypothetical protein
VTADARDWQIPDDVTVAYFANPFTGAIFADVVERIFASIDRSPRRMRIIYHWPREHEMLVATGRARVIRRLWTFRPTRRWARTNATLLYEVLPRADRRPGPPAAPEVAPDAGRGDGESAA